MTKKAWSLVALVAASISAPSALGVQAAVQSGEVVPPTSQCPSDRRLPSSITYAVLPLDGEVGDATMSDAIDEFIKGSPAAAGVNALVVTFNATGGTSADIDRLVRQLLAVSKRMPVIGVLGSATGAAGVLPILCDYVVVLGAKPDAIVIDWAPPSDVPEAKMGEVIERHLKELGRRTGNRIYYTELTRGLLDPTRDLFLWRGPDGCAEIGATAPATGSALQISEGSDTVTGFTGPQLVTAGLAIAADGQVSDLGRVLGVAKWNEKAGVGEKILATIKARTEKAAADQRASLKSGFAAVKTARNLVGALIEAESIARDSDPRRRQFAHSYTRSWGGNRWSYSAGGTFAWRKNCDNATAAWNAVIQIYDAASGATAQAKQVAQTLAASSQMRDNPEFKSDVEALQSEVDALMAQSGMLTIKGQNARAQIAWLQQNYNNPVR